MSISLFAGNAAVFLQSPIDLGPYVQSIAIAPTAGGTTDLMVSQPAEAAGRIAYTFPSDAMYQVLGPSSPYTDAWGQPLNTGDRVWVRQWVTGSARVNPYSYLIETFIGCFDGTFFFNCALLSRPGISGVYFARLSQVSLKPSFP